MSTICFCMQERNQRNISQEAVGPRVPIRPQEVVPRPPSPSTAWVRRAKSRPAAFRDHFLPRSAPSPTYCRPKPHLPQHPCFRLALVFISLSRNQGKMAFNFEFDIIMMSLPPLREVAHAAPRDLTQSRSQHGWGKPPPAMH